MTTLQHVELGVLGPLQVRQHGLPVAVPGAKPRAILTMLGLHGGSVVSADTLAELLWGADPPRTAAKALQTHISSLRRALGDGFVLTEGSGWTLSTTEIDATRYKVAARLGRDAIAAGDAGQAVARFDEALALWRGVPELPEGPRADSERTRWIEGHAALVEDRADALLATGRAAEIIGELEAAIADAPLRERRWGQLMLALYRAGRQGEALAAFQRARSLLGDELGVDPGPNLRRLEAAIVAQDPALEIPVSQQLSAVTKAVTFLLTDIEGSTAAWEAQPDAMAVALARHDEIVERVVTSRGGRLVKTRGEGDATFSVFDRPSAAAAAAIQLQEAIGHEPWALAQPMRIRIALHTGEVELRDGDYFGRAVNRAARLRSLAAGGQILCSGATAELVIDSLADDVVLADLGIRQLRNLARPEHVFELRLETTEEAPAQPSEPPIQRPALPAVLTGAGPFVGRGRELAGLLAAWQSTLTVGTQAVLVAGEPGVGKTRLAGEWSRQAYEQGAVVLYGRCDEDLGAAYQPFAEALRSLVPCLGAKRLRALRGVEALLPLVPGLTEVVPDLPTPPRSDPDTERYALFDAVVALLAAASASAPVVLILDDLHWAAKPTLLLLRHLLRFGEHARVQIVGTYRSTDLDRSHPLAAMLADLHRDGSATRLALSGLDEDDVTAYVAEAGYDDEELARALASVTGGNPFFLIEALRHVDESGGRWDPSTLPQGVREAVSRRLSRLPEETNKALAAAAVVGSRFPLALVESVVGTDLIDAFDEACKAGIVIEEPGGRYRFNHALVRQSLLAELASVRRMRLHQRIAATLEAEAGADDDELLAELAYHYFECAWAGNAAKAVEYCRRAADQAMARLAYEGAAELFDKALHALEELDEELPDRDALQAELLVARCEALLAAGDVVSAAGAVAQLQRAAGDSVRLAAWGACFDGELSMLTEPERLDEIEAAVAAAAEKLAGLEDAAGEAKAHTVRAMCLARLGRIGDAETALDQALTAARRAHEHRRVNAVLAGAPLAALWGPNPVPRAGGRCLDVVRLLRITTGSPVVEATSTRCQGVLDALRGRAAAGRALIDSARRSLTELGMRHALLEVDQFAGIVELVADDPAAAEPLLRRAYDGFRRMGLDADTAETAALLARACLALDRDAEADELCAESERLAGHALKPSIAWRTVRAQLLARNGTHDEARLVAQEAVAVAERTDLLVDHGDACLALATVLDMAGDAAGARAAAERAAELYELKGAAALAGKARQLVGTRIPPVRSEPEIPDRELDNECMRTLRRVDAAVQNSDRAAMEREYAPLGSIESRRKIVGFTRVAYRPHEFVSETETFAHGLHATRSRRSILALRGERLSLSRLEVGTPDVSPGAPQDEWLQVVGLDENGRIVVQVWFDVEDVDAAMAELDAMHAGVELENECVRVLRRVEDAVSRRAWSEVEREHASIGSIESRRKIVGFERMDLPAREMARGADRFIRDMRAVQRHRSIIAIRGERLALARSVVGTADATPGAPQDEMLQLVGLDDDGRIALQIWFDVEDIDAAIAEMEATHARFEHGRPTRRLENAASRVEDQCYALFTQGRADEIAALLAVDHFNEDRRRGLRRVTRDRAAALENIRAIADLGVGATNVPIALRGNRLCLSRIQWEQRQAGPNPFTAETLELSEVDAEGLETTRVVFDPDDVEAAFQELDARYLSGEAAAHAHTWSVIAGTFAAVSHDEVPPMSPDCVTLDHRRTRNFAPGDLEAYVQAGHDLDQHIETHVQVVHRLNDLGAVVGYVAYTRSKEGFDAEWREVSLSIVDGDAVTRCELFEDTDLDTAVAKFDALTRSAVQLENAATRVNNRFDACLADRDWKSMAAVVAADMCHDDRRRVVGAGIRRGRNAEISDMQAIAGLGVVSAKSTVVATRGERLALLRTRFSGREEGPDAFHTDIVDIIEINADDQITRRIAFDADDIEAAFEELEARYLAGEAAAYAQTWSVVVGVFAALARHEMPDVTPEWTSVDHRRGTPLADADLREIVSTLNDLTPNLTNHVESVHALRDHAALFTQVSRGTSPEGFDAEWRMINLMTVDGDEASRCELFDEADLDAALARLDELTRPTPRLENAATRVIEQFSASVSARDWGAVAELLADDFCDDDRRRVVSSAIQRGRDAQIANLRAITDLGMGSFEPVVIAIRGQRLALTRTRVTGGAGSPHMFGLEPLTVGEINGDGQLVAAVHFDDLDAAFEELDARYLAGEAVPYAQAWSVLTQGYAAVRRHELPEWTPDAVNVDHRRGAAFAPGELSSYVREMWHQTPDVSIYIEAVHRLSPVGAVVTHVATGTSQHGFEGEWREITLTTIDGDRIKHSELFDEKDLGAALARFDELCRPATRLTNTASRVEARCQAQIAAGNWDAVASVMADDIVIDDRRRVVNAGLRRGRSAVVDDLRVGAKIGLTEIARTAIATRGEHLTLSHIRYGSGAQRPEASVIELAQLVEIDADERIAALVLFDPEDIHAAFEELDARYLAGEAAAHSQTWSVVVKAYALMNQRGLPATTPRWVNIDHRRGATFASGDMTAYVEAAWADLEQNLRIYVEAAHRLNESGTVVTQVLRGTTREGFDAEWRTINLFTVEGELFSRCELFDEADLDAALAQFDELSRPKPPMENAASQLGVRFRASFAARDWDAMAEMLADDLQNEDRRRVVNGGIRRGKYSLLHDMRSAASFGIQEFATDVIATRGERLVLARAESRYEARPGAFYVENVVLGEIDGDARMTAQIIFDVDDIDAAFEELDARYLTGEAAPYADIWSVIAAGYATLNRHELPPTPPDFVNLDHRKGGGTFAVGDLLPFIHASWEDTPDNKIRVEVVHRLNMFGAVVTSATQGTSRTGFAAEWRQIDLVTVDRGMINRTELFDEVDLDAALAKFDELSGPARLENTATRAEARALACFATRDWASMAEYLAEDLSLDDRRRIVNAGTRRGRSAAIADARAVAGLGGTEITSDVIATRGDRLFLARSHLSSRGQGPETFNTESLCVAMSDDDGRIAARVVFDPDDIDAALAELDARYVASEALPYSRVWSVITDTYAALNRHELAPIPPDWVYVDRHSPALFHGDFAANMRAAWEVMPDWHIDIVAVHRLTHIGAVLTAVARGTSRQGFGGEEPGIAVVTVRDDGINRFEYFDDADLDDALARFDELSRETGRPQNQASRLHERLDAAFSARDWAAMAELLADDTSTDDRRSIVGLGLRRGRDAAIGDWRAIADVGVKDITATVIATRGEHLVLSRYRFGGHDQRSEAYRTEVLGIVEIDDEQRITACVMFDLEEITAAFEELDARYAAGEAASRSHTWTLVKGIFAAMNRSELPAATPDWVVEDHRRLPMIQDASRDAYLAAAIEVPRTAVYIESVHRLGNSAALLSWQGDWTTPDGFDAQWRGISLTIFDGDLIDRVEIFDEDDLDAALARFDELMVPASQLANMASRVADKYEESLAARDWAAMAEVLAEDIVAIDRRRVVNAGVRRGRDVQIADMQAAVEVGFEHMTFRLIATRGERLVLKRVRTRNRGQLPGEVSAEMLGIIEIDADNRIAATVAFDLDDVDAAFAELDSRYLAGEASAHAEVWSVVADIYAALNRRELPATTRDWVNVDHRTGVCIPAGEMTAFLHAAGELTPDARIHVEAVHRVTDLGAVLTQVQRGTSSEGFEAEWREVVIFAVDGDLISRVEIFDEADLDDALARLEELTPAAPQLNNSAIRGDTQAADAFNTRDLDSYLAAFDRDARYEDRRKGLRNEGPVDHELAHGLLFTGAPTWRVEIAPVAIRGPRLALVRHICRDNGEADRPVVAEVLALVEATEDELLCRSILFDPEDIEAAFAELDTRWIASGDCTHTKVDAVQTTHLETFAPLLKNAATRILTRVIDAFSRRDPDGYLALFAKDCMYEDRRKGLRDAGSIRPEYAHTVTFGAAAGWRAEFEPIAVRGEHLMLSRVTFRDLSETGSPIAVEALNLGSLDNDELISWFAIFDPEDIDAAFDELHARWIASGEVDHPEVIESMRQVIECANRQDWDTLAARESGATFVNHRQLGTGDKIGDHWTSLRAMASLIPDIRVDVADIPKHSAKGVVISVVVRGATVEGTAIELPTVILLHFDGPRVTRMEAFDHNQRDQALARFDELDHIGAV